MITQEHLKSILHYDPATGVFTWLLDSLYRKVKGKRAGFAFDAYRAIKIKGHIYLEHVLAFLYMTGSVPEFVDHVNRKGAQNHWINLREATRSQNGANRPAQVNNKSGKKGVYWDKQHQKWRTCIKICGKTVNLGRFDNIEDAAEAYKLKALELFGEFACV